MNSISRRIEPGQVYLKPGEIWIGRKPVRVNTVLGSCISVTFFHPASQAAAICHIMQPRCTQKHRCAAGCTIRNRYAECAIENILDQLRDAALRPSDIEVKLFGGASLMGSQRQETASVGQQNITAAMEMIQKSGLRLQVVNVGGFLGRKIIFQAETGTVLMKHLKNAASEKSLIGDAE